MSDVWQDKARCRQEAPGFMHPDRATREEVAAAIAVCAGCPVVAQCRAAALDHEAYGVWAGEWFGPDPVWETERVCAWCGTGFRDPGGRAPMKFCSLGCKIAGRADARKVRSKGAA